MPPGAAMGRGYTGYGAMPPGYPGTTPMVGAGYGYGKVHCSSPTYSS